MPAQSKFSLHFALFDYNIKPIGVAKAEAILISISRLWYSPVFSEYLKVSTTVLTRKGDLIQKQEAEAWPAETSKSEMDVDPSEQEKLQITKAICHIVGLCSRNWQIMRQSQHWLASCNADMIASTSTLLAGVVFIEACWKQDLHSISLLCTFIYQQWIFDSVLSHCRTRLFVQTYELPG